MKVFKNQHHIRLNNQKKVISLLRTGQKDIRYLANKLETTFMGATDIVNQLLEIKLVKRTDNKSKKNASNDNAKRGRSPALVKINTDLGLTCAIDFSSHELVVTLNDLMGCIIEKRVIPDVLFITEEHLKTIASFIKEMLQSKEIKKRPLVGICIAAPGLINKKTGEVDCSFRMKELQNASITNYYFNEFGVPVHLYNEVKIACVGEMANGFIPSDAQNFLFVHIGNSAGTAIVIDGKLYQGEHGYSGEFSFVIQDEEFNTIDKNRIAGLFVASEEAEKMDNSLKLIGKDLNANISLLKEECEKGNKAVLNAIRLIAKQNATQLIAYNDFLDFDYIIFEGPIFLFKEQYQKWLIEYIKKYSKNQFGAKLLFNDVMDASLLGTIFQANNIYFLKKLEESANERYGDGMFDLSDATLFGKIY